jgi:hypothetical protein
MCFLNVDGAAATRQCMAPAFLGAYIVFHRTALIPWTAVHPATESDMRLDTAIAIGLGGIVLAVMLALIG